MTDENDHAMDDLFDEEYTKAKHEFLTSPMTRLEAMKLVQLLHGAIIPMAHSTMISMVILAEESKSEEHRERAKKGFEGLSDTIAKLDEFDKVMGRLFDAIPTWDHKEGENSNE